MANLLCIETATTNCSVALGINGECVAIREFDSPKYSHAEQLHDFIQAVLTEAKLTFKDLDAVAVSKGPGSYTGLRIGVSAAKGICFAMDIPLISVPTLQVLAKQLKVGEDELIIPMLDARRMEVYTQVFNASHTALDKTNALVLEPTSFEALTAKNKLHFTGNGVAKFKEITLLQDAKFYPNAIVSAREMISIATLKFTQNELEDVAYFEPYYLKDFVAGKPKQQVK